MNLMFDSLKHNTIASLLYNAASLSTAIAVLWFVNEAGMPWIVPALVAGVLGLSGFLRMQKATALAAQAQQRLASGEAELTRDDLSRAVKGYGLNALISMLGLALVFLYVAHALDFVQSPLPIALALLAASLGYASLMASVFRRGLQRWLPASGER